MNALLMSALIEISSIKMELAILVTTSHTQMIPEDHASEILALLQTVKLPLSLVNVKHADSTLSQTQLELSALLMIAKREKFFSKTEPANSVRTTSIQIAKTRSVFKMNATSEETSGPSQACALPVEITLTQMPKTASVSLTPVTQRPNTSRLTVLASPAKKELSQMLS